MVIKMISILVHQKSIPLLLLLLIHIVTISSHNLEDGRHEYIGKFVTRPKRYRSHKYRKGDKSSKNKCKKSKKKKKDKKGKKGKKGKSEKEDLLRDECFEIIEDRDFKIIMKVLFDDIIILSSEELLNVAETMEPIMVGRANDLSDCYYGEDTLLFERAQFIEVNILDETVTEIVFSVSGDYLVMDPDICFLCVAGDSVSRERRRRMEEESSASCMSFVERGVFESELVRTGLPAFRNLIDVEVRQVADCENDYGTCTTYGGPFQTCVDPEEAVGCPQSCCCNFVALEQDHHATSSTACSMYAQSCDTCMAPDEYEYYPYDS